eukprot:GHVN01087232.1.p1 GENE.GHVN01087232.1~~GHVN01087232.1.p1  ORF type:complete len:134 (+),score=17.01 GHVN01087232.1:90-491(+)
MFCCGSFLQEDNANRKRKFMKKSEEAADTYNDVGPQNTEEMVDESAKIVKAMEEVGKTGGSAAAIEALKAAGDEPAAAFQPKKECLIDYSANCPLEFTSTETGCEATPEYKGPCPKTQNDLGKVALTLGSTVH